MYIVIRHQKEIVNNYLIAFDNARQNNNRIEADIYFKKWIKESRKLDILEEINLLMSKDEIRS